MKLCTKHKIYGEKEKTLTAGKVDILLCDEDKPVRSDDASRIQNENKRFHVPDEQIAQP